MRFSILILLGLLSCKQIEESKPYFFIVNEDDLNWTLELEDISAAMFLRNDSILIIDGDKSKFISEVGEVKILSKDFKRTHDGFMLEHYGSCVRTISNFKCKVPLKDSSKVESMYLSIEGINNRLSLSYPTCYILLKEKELKEEGLFRNCTLDFNTVHFQVSDIAQFNATSFVLLYDYTPRNMDMAGPKRVAFLDLAKMLKRSGSPTEYLKEKGDSWKEKLNSN